MSQHHNHPYKKKPLGAFSLSTMKGALTRTERGAGERGGVGTGVASGHGPKLAKTSRNCSPNSVLVRQRTMASPVMQYLSNRVGTNSKLFSFSPSSSSISTSSISPSSAPGQRRNRPLRNNALQLPVKHSPPSKTLERSSRHTNPVPSWNNHKGMLDESLVFGQSASCEITSIEAASKHRNSPWNASCEDSIQRRIAPSRSKEAQKSLVAKTVPHYNSHAKDGPFVVQNVLKTGAVFLDAGTANTVPCNGVRAKDASANALNVLRRGEDMDNVQPLATESCVFVSCERVDWPHIHTAASDSELVVSCSHWTMAGLRQHLHPQLLSKKPALPKAASINCANVRVEKVNNIALTTLSPNPQSRIWQALMKDAETEVCLPTSMRDIGIQVTPSTSWQSSGCASPNEDLLSSRHNTPMHGICSSSTNDTTQKLASLQDLLGHDKSPSDEGNTVLASRPNLQMEHNPRVTVQIDIDPTHIAIDSEADAVTRRTRGLDQNVIIKCSEEKDRIEAWENLQMAKAEAELKKLETKLEKMRLQGTKKIMNKLVAARARAERTRAARGGEEDGKRSGIVGSLVRCFARPD